MIADMMNLQAKAELAEERAKILEEAIKKVLEYDLRDLKDVTYTFGKNKIFDILKEALDREKQIKF